MMLLAMLEIISVCVCAAVVVTAGLGTMSSGDIQSLAANTVVINIYNLNRSISHTVQCVDEL